MNKDFENAAANFKKFRESGVEVRVKVIVESQRKMFLKTIRRRAHNIFLIEDKKFWFTKSWRALTNLKENVYNEGFQFVKTRCRV